MHATALHNLCRQSYLRYRKQSQAYVHEYAATKHNNSKVQVKIIDVTFPSLKPSFHCISHGVLSS
jgi:hypothetical protein